MYVILCLMRLKRNANVLRRIVNERSNRTIWVTIKFLFEAPLFLQREN